MMEIGIKIPMRRGNAQMKVGRVEARWKGISGVGVEEEKIGGFKRHGVVGTRSSRVEEKSLGGGVGGEIEEEPPKIAQGKTTQRGFIFVW